MRRQLVSLKPAPSWSGLLIVAGALITLVVGVLGAELFLSRSSLLLLLAGLVVLFFGWRVFGVTLFPWAVLFLMIPIPAILYNQLTFPLQFLASKFATGLLSVAGVPVLREGNVIRLPAMSLEVVEACSGIRSLISLASLGVVFAYFLESRLWKRIGLVIATVPIAVAANGLRIMGTGLLVQYWDPDKAEGFFHEFSGLVIFMVSVGMLYVAHRLINFQWRTRVGRKAA
jgi:exosortase